ncbi:hypothetical protein EVAR_90478_1 [Eumeta japonica]|uniref:Uncharacterized protein n=1 Tax=Eumeta variegata TaxID=151549 RepID=A0A4C2AB31_EUMVA|nr:hypothetical protein EVAR_90478_1 [Eumeta japonica]
MRLPTVIIRDVLRVNSDEDIVRSLRTQNRHLSEGLGGTRPALYTWGSKAPGMGPVPVGAVFALSRIRTWQAFCKEVSRGRLRDTAHGAFSSGCGVRAKWIYGSVEGGVLLAAGALAAEDRTHTAEDRRPKDALTAYLCGTLHWEYRRAETVPGCRVVKDGSAEGPVKAAIMVLNSDVDVEEDQTLNGENVAAAGKAGNCRIGVVSVYFEETCPSAPWSVWWAANAMMRAVSISATSSILRAAHLERGNTPTFEVYRGSSPQSVVDVTACSSALLDRAEEWQVVRDVHPRTITRSRSPCGWRDDPALGSLVHESTIRQRLDGRVRSSHGCCSNERTLTTEMVKSVGSCDQLDELEGLKRDARTKRRIRNAAPAGGSTWSGYVQAREVYERAVAEAQTTSWKRFCSAQDGESLWDGIYRVIRETGKNREDVLLKLTRDKVDPPFTGAGLGLLLKHSTLEGPGIDGFTSDICQAAIFRDLGLFLAMANKCLELGYSRAWKVAASGDPEAGWERLRPSEVLPSYRGAFDNAWWPALETQLRPWLPVNLHGLVEATFGTGGESSSTLEGVQERDFKGCIQGSIAGPTFWNLILDSLLGNSGNSAYTCRRSRMMWSSCSPDSRLHRRSGGQPRSSSRALLGSQK